MRKEDDEGDFGGRDGFSFYEDELVEDPDKKIIGKRGSKGEGDEDTEFDWADGDGEGMELEGEEKGLRDLGGSLSQLGDRRGNFQFEEEVMGFLDDGRDLRVETEGDVPVMALSRSVGSSAEKLLGIESEGVLGRIRELSNQTLGLNNPEDEEEEEIRLNEINEDFVVLSESRNQDLHDISQSTFIPLEEIVNDADRENLSPSISPREARQLGETYVWGLNRALGAEFENLVSEYLAEVDGLLGADLYEIQQRVETGGVYENGNQRYVIPDMMLFRDGKLTNLLEMKVGLRGLKLKDVEYVVDHFPEAAIKFIFLKSSEDKEEEYKALEWLVDEYLDRNEITGNAHLNEKAAILSRIEVWNMDDVKELLPKPVHEEFFARADRISELSIHQNEDYVAAYNSLNKLRELTEELKVLVRNSVDQASGHDIESIERSIDGAVIEGETYRSYINMAILQKVIVEGSLPSGDLYEYLGMSGNHVLKYSNPMVEAGIIQYTEIVPGTTFLYFRDADRPTYFNTLTSGPKAGFELMQKEGILPEGEVTHYDVAEVLGDRPQRKATIFNLFNQKEIIGEGDLANLVNESHLNSVRRVDEAIKWMYNHGMINREQLPWDTGHYYYWLKSQSKPEFSEIRKFMDGKILHSIEFIENMAQYRFDNFNDFRKYFSTVNTNTSLEKSWREGIRLLPLLNELQNIGSFNVDEIMNLSNKSTDSSNPSRMIEGRLSILVNTKILSKTDNEYTLNNELSSEDIITKINNFEKVKTLNYAKSNSQLDLSLEETKPYALNKLQELGFDREEIIELKGYGQKIYYLVQNGDIDIFHASSLKTLLPEYKERSISMGLRKLAKMDLLDKFRAPKSLKSWRDVNTYYKSKGQEEATLFELKELFSREIRSLFSNIDDFTKQDFWSKKAGDLRNRLSQWWVQDLQVLRMAHIAADKKTGLIYFQQLVDDVSKTKIFGYDVRNQVSRSLKCLSRSGMGVIKMTTINTQKYEYHIQ